MIFINVITSGKLEFDIKTKYKRYINCDISCARITEAKKKENKRSDL